MGCFKDSKLTKESEKLFRIWDKSKTLEKWNLSGDEKFFKEMWFDATNKDFEAGVNINHKDYKKMRYKLEEQIHQLQKPGDNANKIKKLAWVGYAKAMKNPITKNFFHVLSDAQQFRQRHTTQNVKQYQGIMKDLQESIGLYSAQNDVIKKIKGWTGQTNFDKLKNKLEKYDSEYVQELLAGDPASKQNATDKYLQLKDFLDGEGHVFKDFMELIAAGNDAGLRQRYKDTIYAREPYLAKLNNAASKWKTIVNVSNVELQQSITNLIDIISMKYQSRSKVAEKLISHYKEVKDNLEHYRSEAKKGNDKGYAPSYVLDLLRQSLEMRDKMELDKDMSNNQLDDILTQYIGEVQKINTALSPRLKAKTKGGMPVEYFTRNPALYINQFVTDVAKFNYTTYVDRAYLKGVQDLSNVVFKSPGEATAESAQAYMKHLQSMYSDGMGKRIESSSRADNLHRMLTAAQFVSKLGFNVRSPIRNLSQSLFTWKYFGTTEWRDSINEIKDNPQYGNLLRESMNKYGLEFYDIGAVTEGAVTTSDLTSFGIKYQDGYLTRNDNIQILDKMTKAGLDITAYSAKMMQWAENINRRVTFKIAFGSRMKQLKEQKRFADHSNEAVQEKMSNLSGKYAARVTELLHYQYGKHGKSDLMKSKVGSVMFQFQHYAASTLNLQAHFVKDYIKAFKAGDYFGYEAQRLRREIQLTGIANLISIPLGINLTSYLGNEVLGRLIDFARWITGDEESFYGKGPIVSQSVVASDMVELMNLGMAAGFLRMNPSETMTLFTGLKKEPKINDSELAAGIGGIALPQVERWANKSIVPLITGKTDMLGFIRSEFGLYPGVTEMGIDVRQTRKKVNKYFTPKKGGKRKGRGKKGRLSSVNKSGLNATERQNALQSLGML